MTNTFTCAKIFSALFFILSPALVMSQCSYPIPADAHVFSASNTIIATGADNLKILGTNWICIGDTITITSGFGSQTFFLEENAVLKGGGGGSRTVYLKSGALFDAGGGGSQIIYYEDGGNWINCGSFTATYCQPLVFDYSLAPSNGCLATGANEVMVPASTFMISPNPTAGNTSIFCLNPGQLSAAIIIYDCFGKMVQSFTADQFPMNINTSGLAEGVYLVLLYQSGQVIHKERMLIAK